MASPPLRRRRSSVLLPTVLLSAACLLTAAVAIAADPEAAGDRLAGVQRAIESDRAAHRRLNRKAADLAEEIERLDREKVASAAAIRAGEAEMSGLEAQLAALTQEEAQAVSWLAANRRQLADVLSALATGCTAEPANVRV